MCWSLQVWSGRGFRYGHRSLFANVAQHNVHALLRKPCPVIPMADAEANSKAASESAAMLPLTLDIATSTTTTNTSRPETIHKDDFML